jgi:uracil-DNA glycosylase family 4
MNHLASQTSTNQDFLASLLLDMARNGVTDIVSENSRDLFADTATSIIVPTKPPVQEAIKPTVVATKLVQKTPELDLSKHVWMLQEDASIICVSTGKTQGKEPFVAEEKILFDNMLKAMGLDSEKIGYLVVDSAINAEEQQEKLSQISRRLISSSKAKIIISFGESMCPVLMGGNVTLTGARGYGKEVANIKYVATYAPRALLKQPLLKRLAWEDLQIGMGYLKVGDNA